jgi:1,4-dihydroxy-2-naphthoate octaprenyltransferase
MALDVVEAVARARRYSHAVLSFVDPTGYPVSVAGDFVTDTAGHEVTVGPLSPALLPADGQEVGVLFSHIRPQPGIGYDERRYVNMWGPARVEGDTVRVTVARATGWDEQEVPFFEYAERSLPRAHAYLRDVGARPRLSRFWTIFVATRLPFLTATIVPVALGGAVAARDHAFAWGWFALALVAAICVHLGLNIANDLFDDASGADSANVTPTPFSGGSRVLQRGLVSRAAMLRACIALYGAAIVIGLVLVATRGAGLLVIGAAGVLVSIEYTAPPLRLVHHGLGELATAVGFGPLMTLGTYYVLARGASLEALYVSLPVALLIALVLYVNEVPDRASDASVGKRTLAVRWPRPRVVAFYRFVSMLAFGLILVGPIARITPGWTVLALVTFPMARRVQRDLARYYERPYALMPAMQANIGLHLFTGLLLLAGYVLHLALR